MPRPTHPPYGFSCPYTDHCPHLEGLSTTWVFEGYRRAEEVYDEHLRIIDVLDARLNAALKQVRMLEKENAELKAKNTALHRRQFKANKVTPSESEQEEPCRNKEEARGSCWPSRMVEIKPVRVDRTVYLPAPSICPHCGSDNLLPTGQVSEHLQEDIVLRPRTIITRYVHEEGHTAAIVTGLWFKGERMSIEMPLSDRWRNPSPSI